ncbi:alpha-1,2-fucosyltransferase [Arthrobacter bambusae]|uniref:alpha-1,2-fucosyltransferase n=1 Tax=Arthrobacter bambusae TaxID=1338426 RepID=UPI00278B36B2|nr:alpha-1,2-fucosyltransferase [Arthrobacter bambusae]MDQ0031442.1 hypothetical protein [Arthrobacter bambusae]MDQ0099670.1 hypothetical protein [Arthrobacter bambusae]
MSFLRPVSVVALRGGFGNQLFAWAYGQRLNREGHLVLYDRGNQLGRGFALRGLIPNSKLVSLPSFFWRKVGASDSMSFLRKNGFVRIEEQELPPRRIDASPRLVNLHWGYWQSMDYFFEAKDSVFRDIEQWVGRADEPPGETCAIHVRRGDYVSDPKAAAVMGALPLSYYKRAIKRMEQNGYTNFVVYSDDRRWATENVLPLGANIRIAHTRDSEDFVRMSTSAALITANSSFSWWAAFLVSMSGGDVIAPSAWFAEPTLDSSRLVPDTWASM